MVPWVRLTHSGKNARHTHGYGKSPFHNNDDPTPRHVPSIEAEAERASLRREAEMGAGTPGYLTKQQQHGPTSPETRNTWAGPEITTTTSGAARQLPADEALHAEVRRAELGAAPAMPESSAGTKSSGRGDSSDGKASPKHSGRKERPESPHARSDEAGDGAGLKPSEHEQGIWQGFLNIFRTEKKRSSITGVPSQLLDGPTLGEPHELPNPDLSLPLAATEDSLLSNRTQEEGRRGSRKHSVLSPRGAPSARDGSAETADEERMRAYLQISTTTRAALLPSARRTARRCPPR
jgi:hypothetical protein